MKIFTFYCLALIALIFAGAFASPPTKAETPRKTEKQIQVVIAGEVSAGVFQEILIKAAAAGLTVRLIEAPAENNQIFPDSVNYELAKILPAEIEIILKPDTDFVRIPIDSDRTKNNYRRPANLIAFCGYGSNRNARALI